MNKDFDAWNTIKKVTQKRHRPTFNEGEIWWCSIGTNIGDEMDGKSKFFTRPVLIIRKFNRHIFFGVPLTTQIKQSPYYYQFYFKNMEQCALLSQLRIWESKRLRNPMGTLPSGTFEAIKKILGN